MNINTHVRVTTTVDLYGTEKFEWANEAGRPFKVDRITYSGGSRVHFSGFAIKTDGTEGFIRREIHMGWRVLKSDLRKAIKDSRTRELSLQTKTEEEL